MEPRLLTSSNTSTHFASATLTQDAGCDIPPFFMKIKTGTQNIRSDTLIEEQIV